jgi:hypothetical protein
LNAQYKHDNYSLTKNTLLFLTIVGIPWHIKWYNSHLEQQRLNYWARQHSSFDKNIINNKIDEPMPIYAIN